MQLAMNYMHGYTILIKQKTFGYTDLSYCIVHSNIIAS